MTFEEFQATREHGRLVALLPEHDFYGEDPVGLVYAGRLYITELHHPTGRYELILGNRDWLSDDLTALERRLYEYGRDEGAF